MICPPPPNVLVGGEIVTVVGAISKFVYLIYGGQTIQTKPGERERERERERDRRQRTKLPKTVCFKFSRRIMFTVIILSAVIDSKELVRRLSSVEHNRW